ncbi:hypothetical protein [Lentzea cavernae]|uniref:Restriction endonuclease n=1 Tax=Lentzea cavernae TaxID=2020703 RepID=A0ABQ3MV86_9PSEU|nr:hypothetical protein [Lentzea cavernae]GHH61511.1 hypothetical protein GCM10017774_87790 [Lentzea cavernae]
MADYLFTEYWREHRPLRGLLNDWARLAYDRAHGLRRDAFAEPDDAQLLEQLLDDWLRQAKLLGRESSPTAYPEPGQVYRRGENHEYVMHWRWGFKFPLSGNLELLQAWPANTDVVPSSDNIHSMPAPQVVWQLVPGGALALLDVPGVDDPAGVNPPTERLLAATRTLDSIVTATNEEVRKFDEKMRIELSEIIASRRTRLTNIEKNTQATIELLQKECPPLQVEIISASQPVAPILSTQHSKIDLPVAVTRKTFLDLINVTQRWIYAAQRYPSTFTKMEEEEVTSVLVSVLNLAFDTAQREAFVGNGKTDIYVEAERGDRTRAAYVGEAKYWEGPKAVESHLRQVLGYAPTHIREVMFLYYVRAKNIDAIQSKATIAISECAELFIEWTTTGKGARMKHPSFEHDIQVSILYAHFPQRV